MKLLCYIMGHKFSQGLVLKYGENGLESYVVKKNYKSSDNCFRCGIHVCEAGTHFYGEGDSFGEAKCSYCGRRLWPIFSFVGGEDKIKK